MPVTLDLNERASDASTRRALSNLSLSVAKCKKILVVTGAGISCSCGIPDFRSSDGLYALVKQQYPDAILKGRDLFDASLFRDPTSTSVFYTFISQLKRSIDSASPSPTHRFLKTLDTKRKLLRSYTQNIDALEEKAGLLGSSSDEVKSHGKGKAKIRVKEVRNVQLHGDIHRVRCTFCCAEFPCTVQYLDVFETGAAPDCPECVTRSKARVARAARPLKVGTLRPAIVLYDEPHPLGDDIGSMQLADMTRKPDMLIVMGTSLKVHGFKKLVKDFAKIVHESAPSPTAASTSSPKNAKAFAGKVIFVNKTAPGSEWDGIIDYHVVGETDKWVDRVLEEWKKMRPSDWEVQKKLTTTTDVETAGAFKVTKEITNTFDGMKAIAGAKKKPPGKQNVSPVDDLSLLPPLPPSPPPSPSKRRQADCHYNGHCSPSKKRVSGVKPVTFEERGMLFGHKTSVGHRDDAGGLDLGETKLTRKPSSKTMNAKKPNMVVEVVIETRKKPRRGAGPATHSQAVR
ncbi:DHS-like NAD/FAD-binding domain-containing protein [Rhodofomes roseus]|uniref:DHS-like NAD/FAD-binding domain-containing protein n=1 Tax=Rhodofomes roseus TaxID=34475 RepID=A0ABQ8KE66_9APHY|nr:DHS-like NAD/FAD-binding domain-containing protein [Rhodofomes roseus]KAH9835915.1 DHS-like NAD/FAD-binding domain-containing protein [Rhodofomes roseus]